MVAFSCSMLVLSGPRVPEPKERENLFDLAQKAVKKLSNVNLKNHDLRDIFRLGRGRRLVVLEFTSAASYSVKNRIIQYFDFKKAAKEQMYINRCCWTISSYAGAV